MVQYGEAFVNLFAPNLWSLEIRDLPELRTTFPAVHEAMWNVAARELFHGEWKPLVAHAVRQFMRRSILAAQLYEAGRAHLREFSTLRRRDQPDLRAYFGALDSFEGCILQLEFCVENLKHVLEGDGKKELEGSTQTLSKLSMSIRHSGGIAKGAQQRRARKLLPVYLTNSGLTNGKEEVSFSELCKCASEFARITSEIFKYNPGTQ